MGLSQYKTLILVVTAALALLIASPSIQQLLVYPQTDSLTEFWMFGPNHDAAYPGNVTADQTYRIYLDVTNHLGSAAYYNVEIKFRNQTQSGPGSYNRTPSDLPALSSIAMVAADNQTTEAPLDISFQYHVVNGTTATLYMDNVTVNGFALDASATTITWDKTKDGFFGNLVFELYIYNSTTNAFQYHQRYLSLWLRMNS
jgi:Predicted membrane protein